MLEADVLDLIPVNGRCSVEREVFPALACTGQLFGFAHDVYWLDTGRPESLLQANEDIFAGRRPGVVAVDHPDVTVAPSATVIGTALPAGSSIASDATVIDSVLLDGARIGPGAVVRRSLVGRMAVVASGSQVDNTVLGDGARTEPGEQLDQARRPEQQV